MTVEIDNVGEPHSEAMFSSCVVKLRLNGNPYRVTVYEFHATGIIDTDCWEFNPRHKRWNMLGAKQAAGVRQAAVDAYKRECKG